MGQIDIVVRTQVETPILYVLRATTHYLKTIELTLPKFSSIWYHGWHLLLIPNSS